jgi:DNA-binding response OmpR family regulator
MRTKKFDCDFNTGLASKMNLTNSLSTAKQKAIPFMALNCGLPSMDGIEPSRECRLG